MLVISLISIFLCQTCSDEGAYKQMEAKICALLHLEPLTTPAELIAVDKSVIENFTPGYQEDVGYVFDDTAHKNTEGKITLNGAFSVNKSGVSHAETTADLSDKIILRYHSAEVSLITGMFHAVSMLPVMASRFQRNSAGRTSTSMQRGAILRQTDLSQARLFMAVTASIPCGWASGSTDFQLKEISLGPVPKSFKTEDDIQKSIIHVEVK